MSTRDDYEIDFTPTPQFQSVTGLTNTTLDPLGIVAHRAATEGQVKAIYNELMAIHEWAVNNAGASNELFEAAQNKLNETAALIEACGDNDASAAVLNAIWTKLEALEAQVATCLQKPCFGSGTDGADGNVVTVSFSWNSTNPIADGGTATATSAMTDHNITGFFFLCRDDTTGLYYRSEIANGGDYTWNIDTTTGAVTATAGTTARYAHVIVAADDHGNEGMCLVELPTVTA